MGFSSAPQAHCVPHRNAQADGQKAQIRKRTKNGGRELQMAKVSTLTSAPQAQSLPLLWIAKFTLSATKLLLPIGTYSQVNITFLQFLNFLRPLSAAYLWP